ncbi:MAG: FUSC family protein, partial [Gammaproteobacteria bacterium]|nr:FUSC family protein [Gammaproteobacteria bacterium]
MAAAASPQHALLTRWRALPAATRTGWQLLAAVLLAQGLVSATRLPESSWAVMSALIVVRPGTSSTLAAGFERVRGALAGALAAMVGVGSMGLGIDAAWITVGIVGLLAFWSSSAPGLRSAPITALIVMQSAATVGHSPWHVASLRLIEIGIGTAAGVLVTLPRIRRAGSSRERFERRAAELLRDWADEFSAAVTASTAADVASASSSDSTMNAASAREELTGLMALARAADRVHRWQVRWRPAATGDRARSCEEAARRVGRTFGDLAALARMAALLPPGARAAVPDALCAQVTAALLVAADWTFESSAAGSADRALAD